MAIDLKELQVLVIDCQATGNSPKKSHLLEIGWQAMRAGDPIGVQENVAATFLVKLPDKETLPPQVERLTGIGSGHLDKARPAMDIWPRLVDEARQVAATNGLPRCPAVIHFARFETPFLKELHRRQKTSHPFPLDIICTHTLSKRLWPSLPRKGLRAVAGFLGHSVPVHKRCDAHITATAVIWHHLVNRLAGTEQISTLEALLHWLAHSPELVSSSRVYPMPRKSRLGLPDTPGVYRLMRANDDLLYIGKTNSLKRRVNSYFQASRSHSESTLEMLTQAVKLDVTLTGSALEAALRESEEIKQCRPPYNIALTADNRELVFFSADFQHYCPQPNDICRLGPVAIKEIFTAAHVIGKLIAMGDSNWTDIDAVRILALPQRFCPHDECLRAGLTVFIHKHADLLRGRPMRRALMCIGRLSWIEKKKRHDQTPDHNDDSAEDSAQETDKGAAEFSWTLEAVVSCMESLLRRCGHQLRRARWFTILSEATVAWETQSPKGNGMHLLVLENGQVFKRSTIPSGSALPVPPGYKIGFRERLPNLDLQAYDRLRVLTTELRRLATAERSMVIRLSRSAFLGSNQVKRLLKWV